MDIRVLQYFLAVAREESITKAAEALRMTQPPLSRQLKDLEEELGKQLLIRGSKKVTLTEDGMLLRKRAEELVDLMERQRQSWHLPVRTSAGIFILAAGKPKAFPFWHRQHRIYRRNTLSFITTFTAVMRSELWKNWIRV